MCRLEDDEIEERVQEKLKEKVSKLEQKLLRDVRDEFITDLSHNIRTPLTCIKLAVTMLRNVTDEETRNRYLEILENECDKEIAFVNSILENIEDTADTITVED